MEIFCIRIGNAATMPADKRRLSIWVSPRDLAQLVQIGIDHPDIRFEIVYGVSGNRRSWYDNSNAERLGYRPQDDAEQYATEVLAREKPVQDERSELHQGGNFVSAEIGGDPSRVTPKVNAKQAAAKSKAKKAVKATKAAKPKAKNSVKPKAKKAVKKKR
jgi:uronate dehydrogenase